MTRVVVNFVMLLASIALAMVVNCVNVLGCGTVNESTNVNDIVMADDGYCHKVISLYPEIIDGGCYGTSANPEWTFDYYNQKLYFNYFYNYLTKDACSGYRNVHYGVASLQKICPVNVTVFCADRTQFNPHIGETIQFSGTISQNCTQSVSWTISVAGRTFTGSGLAVSVLWDGKDNSEKIVFPGNYIATLIARNVDGDSASKTTTVEVLSSCIDNDQDGHNKISSYCPGSDDCNDNDPTIYPGALELCDGKDNNCNGQIDEASFKDNDHDGFSVQAGGCSLPGVYDCNDNDSTIYPGAPEKCGDLVDNNCNGQVDENCSSACTTCPCTTVTTQ